MIEIPKNTVYNEEEIELQDGKKLVLKPAVIKAMRAGNKKMAEFPEAESEDAALTIMLEAVLICVGKQLPDGYTLEDAEEVFDMPTVYKILEVCLGIKLNDPKLLDAVNQMEDQKE